MLTDRREALTRRRVQTVCRLQEHCWPSCSLARVGAVVAARILADVGDVARFADRNRFASWTGTAPLDQIRLDTPAATTYRGKRAAGKKQMEAMRCLKRRICDAFYRQVGR